MQQMPKQCKHNQSIGGETLMISFRILAESILISYQVCDDRGIFIWYTSENSILFYCWFNMGTHSPLPYGKYMYVQFLLFFIKLSQNYFLKKKLFVRLLIKNCSLKFGIQIVFNYHFEDFVFTICVLTQHKNLGMDTCTLLLCLSVRSSVVAFDVRNRIWNHVRNTI